MNKVSFRERERERERERDRDRERERERVSNIKPIIDQYNLKETDFPSFKKDLKKF